MICNHISQADEMNSHISRKVTVFHGRETPEEGFLVGYALLIDKIEKFV